VKTTYTTGRRFDLDCLDVRILKKLNENCRTAFEVLARELNLTSTSIKKRVRKLVYEEKLKDYVLNLSYSALRVDRIIILITTDSQEDRESMVAKIGASPLIEQVCCLSDGRYLVYAVCRDTSDLVQLDHFLNDFINVISTEMHPIEDLDENNGNITKMQLEIVNCLQSNPRMESSKVAATINRSAKGVRMAIKRLFETGLVRFSTQCDFALYFVKVKQNHSKTNPEEITSLISSLYPSAWEVMVSSIKPVVFITFAIERLDEIGVIQKRLRELPSLILLEETVCEYIRHFRSIRNDALELLIENNEHVANNNFVSTRRTYIVKQR
jgi:DNA-binding Lrp family transcriptional regulator